MAKRTKEAEKRDMRGVDLHANRPSLGMLLVIASITVYLVLFFSAPIGSVPTELQPSGVRRTDFWLLLAPQNAANLVRGWFGDGAVSVVDRLPILAAAGAIFTVAVALGWIALRVADIERDFSRLESFLFSFGVGMNLLSLLTLLMGMAGQLWLAVFIPPAVAVAGIIFILWRDYYDYWKDLSRLLNTPVSLIALFRYWPKRGRDVSAGTARVLDTPTSSQAWRAGIWLFASVPFVTVILLGAMLPPVEFDVREYHLQAPKEFYQAGRIAFLPHNVYANMPLGAEMLALLGMTLTGDWWLGALVGKTLIAAFAPMTALGLFAAGRRFFSPTVGALAAVVYISTPWVAFVSTNGLVEGVSAFYLLTAAYAVVRAVSSPPSPLAGEGPGVRGNLLALAGFLAGAAVACKYPAILFVLIPLAVLIVCIPATRRGVIVFLICAAFACGPWFVKNWVLARNPIYPLLPSVFGDSGRAPELIERWNHAHQPPNFHPSDFVERVANSLVWSDWLSPLLVPLAFLAVIPVWRHYRRDKPGGSSIEQLLIVVAMGYLVFYVAVWWTMTHRLERFLVPALPVVALVAGVGAVWSSERLWRRTLVTLLIIGLTFNFLVITSGLLGDNSYFAALAFARTNPQRVDPWHLYLNTHTAPTRHVLLVGDAQVFDLDPHSYDIEPHVHYNTTFDPSAFKSIAGAGVSKLPPEEVRRLLTDRRIEYIYVHWGEIERYRAPGNYGFANFVQPELFDNLVRAGVLEPIPPIPGHPGRMYLVVDRTRGE